VKGAREFRADVEGMRAVAVGLVLLYHGGVPLVRAGFVGVDVFFVISGFLITGMLVREVEGSGRVSLARFYARRAKRLLPAAALVLAVTAALVYLLVPPVDRPVFAGDVSWAALYAVNWRLADRSVDYLAEDVGVSPVQHYWSLSVEEQFYLVWPVLLLLVAWWVRRSGWSVRRSMAAGLSLVAIPSLAWSIALTRREPSAAFFVTTTRMWELAMGAFVAIAAARLARLPRRAAAATAWLGLAAVLASAMVYSTRTPWPGLAALLPTLATAVVIGAGPAAGDAGPVRLLGTRPMVWVGGLSYSLYLWHWPLLVVAAARWGELGPLASGAVLAVATACAWLAYRLVEDPLRHAPSMARTSWLPLTVGAGLSVVGLGAGLAVAHLSAAEVETRRPRGAAVLADDPRGDPAGAPVDRVDWFVPDPVDAPADVPLAYRDNCQVSPASSDPITCEYGDPKGSWTLAMVGDSKILQWLPALDPIAKRRGWKLVTYTKSGCPFTDSLIYLQRYEPYDSCLEWNHKVIRLLLAGSIDAVITSQNKSSAIERGRRMSREETIIQMADGLHRHWKALRAAGVEVVAVRDTPRPDINVLACVAENRDRLSACTYQRAAGERINASYAQLMALARTPGVHWIDLNDAICPTAQCAPVIGNALVYRQGSHITATYVETLTPRLEAALSAVLAP
jgi:peptidoglycan/LPS O-acetylase OafA/YrhL